MKCRDCKKEVDKKTTIFGYCRDCQIALGGEPNEEAQDAKR